MKKGELRKKLQGLLEDSDIQYATYDKVMEWVTEIEDEVTNIVNDLLAHDSLEALATATDLANRLY